MTPPCCVPCSSSASHRSRGAGCTRHSDQHTQPSWQRVDAGAHDVLCAQRARSDRRDLSYAARSRPLPTRHPSRPRGTRPALRRNPPGNAAPPRPGGTPLSLLKGAANRLASEASAMRLEHSPLVALLQLSQLLGEWRLHVQKEANSAITKATENGRMFWRS
eukprot:464918-Pleurochrysis_carterae.AAC.2